ncbi:MAG: hypothetical protein ABIH83_01220 [Candidatus Micrarchaeota archaeon]
MVFAKMLNAAFDKPIKRNIAKIANIYENIFLGTNLDKPNTGTTIPTISHMI